MKNILLLLFCTVAAVVAAYFSPSLTAEPPNADWLSHAQLIQTGRYKIYYDGKADGAYSADKKHWTGTVTGRVYVFDSNGSTIDVPKGIVRINKDDTISVDGPHKMDIIAPQQGGK
ncbi:MAG TPA: hypothetical protein VG733_06275 [Chthoniobacteraceae bacterium]|nr:hypothetical protein [Chthoniobacteraceae bacterium]